MLEFVGEKSGAEGMPLSDAVAIEQYEESYRQYALEADFRQTKIVSLIVLAGTLFFIPSDYQLFGASSKLWWLLCARLVLIASSVALFLKLKSRSTPGQFDAYVLSYMIVMVVVSFYISLTRPSSYLLHVIVSVLIINMLYLAFPLPVRLQIIPALLGSLANIILLLVIQSPADSLSKTAILFGFLFANVIGILASRQTNYWKRQQFIALLREKEVRLKLEQALDEIKTLRGIIPICAYCKNVRNDPGSWEQIEEYVTTHTHAQFTHGICPDCEKKHFGYLKRNR